MSEAVRRPTGGQQHFGGQAEIILRQRTDSGGIADLSLDQPHAALGDAEPIAVAQAATPGCSHARATSRILRQIRGAMRRREGGVAIGHKLITDAGIMQRMGKAIGMVERFGRADSLCETSRRLWPGARQLQRVAELHMGANARIMTAEGMAEVTVPSMS